MLAIAALTGPLPKIGVVMVAALAAAALLVREPRGRAQAIAGAIVLAPVLLVAEIWNSPQLAFVHRHPLFALVGAVLLLALLVGVAVVISRRPSVLAVLAIAALPFRVPIATAGTTSNLLVPLYLVVAAGALSLVWQGFRAPRAKAAPDTSVPATTLDPSTARARAARAGELTRAGSPARERPPAAGWLERLLALYIVLYAVQAVYSGSFESALRNMVFFYVPFSLLYVLLSRLRWTPRLIRLCFSVIVAAALIFAAIGFVEYATKTIFLNPKLIVANDLHTYFTVNSVFFDPDIFGRFLMLVMIGLATVLLFGRRQREQVGVTLSLAVLWAALVLTLSRSSLAALLLGLGIIAAVRWHVRRAVIVAAVVVAVGAVAVAVSPTTFGLNQGLNGASSGRANLVTRGLHLFSQRLVGGYGSGSFERQYQRQYHGSAQTLSASHTIAVTIAAEQGLIGELAYLALVIAAIVRLLRGARSDPTRIAVAAAFVALVFHTLLYADFLEDPVTWALLAVGSALALAAAPRTRAPARERARARAGARTAAAA
ncbi:MAG TPA: O-antigen ligase family protein [Solirubrobacteraceae bacterium]|jgi:O-antigen ligase|nr:O-antigen ligase family protein [Solirubrobacteraceae bacterium]